MKTALKNIASNIIAGIIFVASPSILVAVASGYKELGEYGIYSMIVLGLPYYLLNREKYNKVQTDK